MGKITLTCTRNKIVVLCFYFRNVFTLIDIYIYIYIYIFTHTHTHTHTSLLFASLVIILRR